MKYAVVIEKGSESFGAYAPDLPGCAVVGKSQEEVFTLTPIFGGAAPRGDSQPHFNERCGFLPFYQRFPLTS